MTEQTDEDPAKRIARELVDEADARADKQERWKHRLWATTLLGVAAIAGAVVGGILAPTDGTSTGIITVCAIVAGTCAAVIGMGMSNG